MAGALRPLGPARFPGGFAALDHPLFSADSSGLKYSKTQKMQQGWGEWEGWDRGWGGWGGWGAQFSEAALLAQAAKEQRQPGRAALLAHAEG
jgi:hypothetical protein